MSSDTDDGRPTLSLCLVAAVVDGKKLNGAFSGGWVKHMAVRVMRFNSVSDQFFGESLQ